MPLKRSGQSTIEYILLLTAVVVVVVAFISKNGMMARAVNEVLKMPAATINKNPLTFTFTMDPGCYLRQPDPGCYLRQ